MKIKRLISIFIVFFIIISAILIPSSSVNASKVDGSLKGCHIIVGGVIQQTNTNGATGYKNSTGNSYHVYCIPAGTILTTSEYKNGRFKCVYNKKTVWINDKRVMINLKDYIPSLQIDLDLARDNGKILFNAGDKKIKGVSDTKRYKNNTAWARYGVATRLLKAQTEFKKQGYSIKIYDAYRPYSVSKAIYQNFSKYMNTQEGKKIAQNTKYYNSTYPLNSFLGNTSGNWKTDYSFHNYGQAVDITLVSLSNNKEISMPTKMHTLDKRSAYGTWKNSSSTQAKHAKYMRSIMQNAGFRTIESEWWHFQVFGRDMGANGSIKGANDTPYDIKI